MDAISAGTQDTDRPFIASHSWRGESNHGSSLAAARRLKCLAVLSRGGLSRGARTTSVSRVRLLTIVGGVRERWVATRRGRGKTVCARGARRALLRGPSTSPLEGLFGGGAELNAVTFLPVVKIPSFPRRFGATASAPELHCLMNRSGITVTVAAADAGVAPLRGREHCALAASFVAGFRSRSELRAGAR